jgi:predicted RNA methylase
MCEITPHPFPLNKQESSFSCVTMCLCFFFVIEKAENSLGDVSNKIVADFGCGCGTLGAAASLMGAE